MFDEIEKQLRRDHFPRVIHQISLHDPIVRDIIHSYVNGGIVALNEALCQMIVAQAKRYNNSEYKD